ncbi:MAG: hypothetical protein RLZZ469_750, partial [Bacteroidota bacterium]
MFPLFHFSLWLKGFPIKKAQTEFDHIQNIAEEEYPQYIAHKRNEIVAFHLNHNTSYRALVGNANPKNWEALPVMTKKDFQKPLQERLSEGYTTKTVYVNKTSGSSGDPFIFAKDKFSHALTWVNIIARFGWFGIDFNQSLQA